MTATIEFAFVVFGLALLFWTITAPPGTSPGRKAAAGGVGIVALIIGLLLGVSKDHHRDWEDRS
jgi:hypothetical protein